MRRQVGRVGQLRRGEGLATHRQVAQTGRRRDREAAGHRAVGLGNRLVAIASARVVGVRDVKGRHTRFTCDQLRSLDGLNWTTTICPKLKGQWIYRFDNTQQFDEGMPFITTLTNQAGCRRVVFEQGIKITTRLQCSCNLLQPSLFVRHSAVRCIGKNLSGHLGV